MYFLYVRQQYGYDSGTAVKSYGSDSVSGHTPLEKFHIARRHLLPKAMKAMGIKAQNLKVTDGALEK